MKTLGKHKKKRRSDFAFKAAVVTALLQLITELVKLVEQLVER